MCRWCIAHGEGKLWYKNAKNYAHKLYRESLKRSEPPLGPFPAQVDELLAQVLESKLKHPQRYPQLKSQLERILHGVHFGQVVPLPDLLEILDIAYPIVKLSCVCRLRSRALPAERNRYCLGIGVGMYEAERWPDLYPNLEFISPSEAKSWIQQLNAKGLVHTIWTFKTPFIGGICNCEYPSCLGIRLRLDYDIQILFKGEYVAKLDPGKCKGCGKCIIRCQFGALRMEVSLERVNLDVWKCFGCGLCVTGCPQGALQLIPRSQLPGLAQAW